MLAGTNHPASFKCCALCQATYSAAEWVQLPLIGIQTLGGKSAELRNCRCGSTLAIPVRTPKPTMIGVAPPRAGSAPTPTRKSAFSGRYSFVHEAYMQRLVESESRGFA